MRLKDLVKPLGQMSDEELMEHLRQVRHRRTVEKPATRARVERAEKKVSRGRLSTLEKTLSALTPEQRAELMKQLEENNNGEGSAV